jgi:hypothetical protein
MPDLITERDPIVVHSYTPTHPQHPDEYAQVLRNLETTYRELIRLVDSCESCGEFDYSRIEMVKERYLLEEKRKDEMYARFFG